MAAANEERFTRVKLQGGMPRRSIEAVLATARVAPDEIEAVAVGGCATPTVATRIFRPLQSLYGPSLGICFDRPWHPVDLVGDLVRYRLPLTRARSGDLGGRTEGRLAEPVVRRGLPAALRRKPLVFVDHHLAHAESAWRTAGPGGLARRHGGCARRRPQLHGLAPRLARRDGARRCSARSTCTQSVGAYYSIRHPKRLGFTSGPARGQGARPLAARGDREHGSTTPFPFRLGGRRRCATTATWGLEGMPPREGCSTTPRARGPRRVGAGRYRIDPRARSTRSALAAGLDRRARGSRWRGACSRTSVVNGEIAALPDVERIHVFPHMGDGGLAAGAALHVAGATRRHPLRCRDARSRARIRAAREAAASPAAGCRVTAPADPDAALVDALATGRPVRALRGARWSSVRARSATAPCWRPPSIAAITPSAEREALRPRRLHAVRAGAP